MMRMGPSVALADELKTLKTPKPSLICRNIKHYGIDKQGNVLLRFKTSADIYRQTKKPYRA